MKLKSFLNPVASLVSFALAFAASNAHAVKLSEMFIDNTAGEVSAFLLFFIFVMAAVGVVFFIMSALEWKKQKASGPQADWSKFTGLLVTGIFLGIAVPVYLATIDSTSGEQVELNTTFDGGGL